MSEYNFLHAIDNVFALSNGYIKLKRKRFETAPVYKTAANDFPVAFCVHATVLVVDILVYNLIYMRC